MSSTRPTFCARSAALVALFAAITSPACADRFGSGDNAFHIEFVTIGDPGNAADQTGSPSPVGAVAYSYRIARYEISETMVDRANAESAASAEPLSLTHYNRGGDHPATNISWYEAAMFTNWLNSNAGHAPAYRFDSSGAFHPWEPGGVEYDPSNAYRSRLTHYFLPSLDEWYKAAYYDPRTLQYYDYPTGSNDQPDGLDSRQDNTFELVYRDASSVLDNQTPRSIYDVGVPSPYGVAGLGGNASEWQETALGGANSTDAVQRYRRGGSSGPTAQFLQSTTVSVNWPWVENFNRGFRVASVVPEPTALLFCLLATGPAWFTERH